MSRGAPPEFVTADGRRLEVVCLPPARPGLPTIVLLHEGLGSVAHWRDWPERLRDATGCAILAYSRYGHGQSDVLDGPRAVDYMHREGEIVLPELLRRLGIERPILLGHSDGASIALIYAGTNPDGAAGLILEAPHVFVEDVSIAGIAAAREAYRSTDLPHKLARYHQEAERTFWGWNDIWLDPAFRDWNIKACLPAIACPVLLIQGEDDAYGTRAQLDAIAARVPDTEVVLLPHCGHAPHRDQPEAVLGRVTAFVKAMAKDVASN